MSTGRKSLFAFNHAENLFNYNLNETSLKECEAVILDVCGAHKPVSNFIDTVYTTGVFFIVYCYNTKEIYEIMWNQSYDVLRCVYGQDTNIIGREIIFFTKSFFKEEIKYCRFDFAKVHKTSFPDESTLNYISARSIGGIPIDYSSAINSYGVNLNDGDGEIWSILK